MPGYFTPKEERMYQHILDSSGGNKGVAAATVNKWRKNHGRTKTAKTRKRKG